MTTALDVPAGDLIQRTKQELEDHDSIERPDWAAFAKTGTSRELPPEEDDWWEERSAAILRKVYDKGPIGVSKLKRLYGGKDRSGMGRSHHSEGSGSVVRTSLQQLEDAGLVESTDEGRVVTPEGRRLLDGLADEIAGDLPELEGY